MVGSPFTPPPAPGLWLCGPLTADDAEVPARAGAALAGATAPANGAASATAAAAAITIRL
jgi:hypothetical protein